VCLVCVGAVTACRKACSSSRRHLGMCRLKDDSLLCQNCNARSALGISDRVVLPMLNIPNRQEQRVYPVVVPLGGGMQLYCACCAQASRVLGAAGC
jgi:hypothetical protein